FLSIMSLSRDVTKPHADRRAVLSSCSEVTNRMRDLARSNGPDWPLTGEGVVERLPPGGACMPVVDVVIQHGAVTVRDIPPRERSARPFPAARERNTGGKPAPLAPHPAPRSLHPAPRNTHLVMATPALEALIVTTYVINTSLDTRFTNFFLDHATHGAEPRRERTHHYPHCPAGSAARQPTPSERRERAGVGMELITILEKTVSPGPASSPGVRGPGLEARAAGFQAASRNWKKFDGGKYLATGLLARGASRANATASSTTADLAFCPNFNRSVTEKFSRFSAQLIDRIELEAAQKFLEQAAVENLVSGALTGERGVYSDGADHIPGGVVEGVSEPWEHPGGPSRCRSTGEELLTSKDPDVRRGFTDSGHGDVSAELASQCVAGIAAQRFQLTTGPSSSHSCVPRTDPSSHRTHEGVRRWRHWIHLSGPSTQSSCRKNANQILTAHHPGHEEGEPSNNVKLAATQRSAQLSGVHQANFDKETERHFIMQVVCEATQCVQTPECVWRPSQNLVKIMSLYYQYMRDVHGPRPVRFQWQAGAGAPLKHTSKFYAKGALQYLVPILTQTLTNRYAPDIVTQYPDV
ncbi:unnamed protein product, partial [Pleuronectes platessa]